MFVFVCINLYQNGQSFLSTPILVFFAVLVRPAGFTCCWTRTFQAPGDVFIAGFSSVGVVYRRLSSCQSLPEPPNP